jgi:hypothetical protein
VEEATEEVLRVFEKLSIVMSPQHAKMFLQVFQRNLGRYEEKLGEIKLAPGILQVGDAQQPTGLIFLGSSF